MPPFVLPPFVLPPVPEALTVVLTVVDAVCMESTSSEDSAISDVSGFLFGDELNRHSKIPAVASNTAATDNKAAAIKTGFCKSFFIRISFRV